MEMVCSFATLLQVFDVTMTRATAQNLRELVIGWVFAPRRTITGMLRAGGIERHHSAFHRLFANAKWSIDRAGHASAVSYRVWPRGDLLSSGFVRATVP